MPLLASMTTSTGEIEAARRSGDEDLLIQKLRDLASRSSRVQRLVHQISKIMMKSPHLRIRHAAARFGGFVWDRGNVEKVLEILQTTTSNRVRNAAAIALADMGIAAAGDVIIGLLMKNDSMARGTLLYALDELGSRVPINVLVDSLLKGPYETRQEAVGLIEAGRAEFADRDFGQVASKLEMALTAGEPDLAVAAGRALDYLRTHGQSLALQGGFGARHSSAQ